MKQFPVNSDESSHYHLRLLVIVSCGTTFGGLTGYAMNAARDTAPRLAFAILPIKGKGDADWAYGLTAPLIGPFIGALVAVALYAVIPWM